jgi:hypothetical protein
MTRDALVERAFEVFRDDASSPPPLSLRGGDQVDSYRRAEPYDERLDAPTDEYLERFAFCGLVFLDARSWRHYLPRLIEYAVLHPRDPAMVAEALVRSLRPPDRYPPRLAALTPEQESVVVRFLERVALGDLIPGLEEEAQQALEEWWLPNPRRRPTPEQIATARAAPVAYREVGEGPYRLSLPVTVTGSGVREIPQESRRVETWGGYLCADVHTMVSVTVTPLAVRSLAESIRLRRRVFRGEVEPVDIEVRGARRARRLDGVITGDSPAERQELTMVFAVHADELTTLSVRTWPRDDVRRVVERIVESFEIVKASS